MGLQQEGEYGLRRRLRMTYEGLPSWATIASLLEVDPGELEDYMTIPDSYLDADTYAVILNNLDILPRFQHRRANGPNWRIVFDEKARWTEVDVDGLTNSLDAQNAVLFVQAETYPEDIMSVGPDDLEVFSIQQLIDAATEGDYDRLVTIVWYIPVIQYPFPSR